MDQRWSDPEAPWWAKLRRAQTHISEVQQRISALQQAQPWSIQREPTGPDRWIYRFKVHQAIPADLSAAVGDAVANMRAALDYIAYELARHHVGTMNDAEEAATQFPICEDKAAFDQFFTVGRKAALRAKLYGLFALSRGRYAVCLPYVIEFAAKRTLCGEPPVGGFW